jgi:hypothetical protein
MLELRGNVMCHHPTTFHMFAYKSCTSAPSERVSLDSRRGRTWPLKTKTPTTHQTKHTASLTRSSRTIERGRGDARLFWRCTFVLSSLSRALPLSWESKRDKEIESNRKLDRESKEDKESKRENKREHERERESVRCVRKIECVRKRER